LLECAISPLKEVPIWGENFYVIAANCGKEMPRGNDLQGCWVDATAPREMISLETLDAIVGDATAHGIVFFGILGGEPFLHNTCLTCRSDTPTATPRSSPTAS
jgi:hypothetical protein